jgi:hypothetical protein
MKCRSDNAYAGCSPQTIEWVIYKEKQKVALSQSFLELGLEISKKFRGIKSKL